MGKARKTSKKFKRESVDWVVNDTCYTSAPYNVANGGLIALPLTWPQMQLDLATFSTIPIGGYAMPEPNERLFVKAVMGSFHVMPSVWAAGTSFTWVARIVKKPMDFATGDAIADSLYNLNGAEYANERFSWQQVQRQRFDLGGVGENIRVNANVNKSLEPDEALFFIFENISGITQSLNLMMFLRTLVRT